MNHSSPTVSPPLTSNLLQMLLSPGTKTAKLHLGLTPHMHVCAAMKSLREALSKTAKPLFTIEDDQELALDDGSGMDAFPRKYSIL